MKDIEKIFKGYKENNFSIFPTQKDKSPKRGFMWKVENTKVSDFDLDSGIGVICGRASHGLQCLDFDDHYGDAKKTMSDYLNIEEVKTVFEKHKLPINTTQGGGYHLLFRCSTIMGNEKLAQKSQWNEKSQKFKPDAIIETRGEGGYFIAPPTEGYSTLKNHILTTNEISAEEMEILITAAKSFNEWQEDQEINDSKPSERIGDIYDADPNSIYEAKASLERAGWKNLGGGRWRRPDKKIGISATFGKVAANVFYNFTSNGHPFNEMSGYTPFRIVGLLDYNADFKAFTKELAQRYDKTNKKVEVVTPDVVEENTALKDKMESILSGAFIDPSIPVAKPPTAMLIRSGMYGQWQRLFTLGNFSAIDGKAKSRKTFLTSLMNAAAAGNEPMYDLIKGNLPSNKTMVIRFDTEQSEYDAYVVAKRVDDMVTNKGEHYATFDLREYSPMERCEIIEFTLAKFRDNIGLVILDGIADLATSNGDEVEATRVVSLLLKWTKIYNCHIINVIHQNKSNDFATGFLGSSIMKKSEAILSVTKEEENPDVSVVECKMIRGVRDFEPFRFNVDGNGMPVILGKHGISSSFEDLHS